MKTLTGLYGLLCTIMLISVGFIGAPVLAQRWRCRATVTAHARRSMRLAWLLGIGLVVLMLAAALLLYQHLGSAAAWSDWQAQQRWLQHNQALLRTPAGLTMMAHSLDQRIKQQPLDGQAWYLRGRLAVIQKKYPLAEQAFARAYQLNEQGDNQVAGTTLWYGYAQAIYLAHGMLTTRAKNLLQRCLQHDPWHQGALLLLATDAYQHQQPGLAIAYWRQLQQKYPPDTAVGQSLTQAIDKASRQRQPGKHIPKIIENANS